MNLLTRAAAFSDRQYPKSLREADGCQYALVVRQQQKMLVTDDRKRFSGASPAQDLVLAELTHETLAQLAEIFPELRPTNINPRQISFGLGDRVGSANGAHIGLVQEYNVFPVLAQQSMRELTLSGGRTYRDVIDCSMAAVFESGYTDGYAADGDHLKQAEDIRQAVAAGCTFITLDCSEHLQKPEEFTTAAAAAYWASLPADEQRRLELIRSAYDAFSQEPVSDQDFKRLIWIYHGTLPFIQEIYRTCIAPAPWPVDFEISVDETSEETHPFAHWLLGSWLGQEQVEIFSLAPRFYGEFQKGIDYIGERALFRKSLQAHEAMAAHFGYRLSIHSGSDKFSIFPLVAELIDRPFHIKTAGTNWLEAVRFVAGHHPAFFAKVYQASLGNFEEALKHYHISTKPQDIAPLADIAPQDYPRLLEDNAYRQFLHINFGAILGQPDFRKELEHLLLQDEPAYYKTVQQHIQKHFDLLGIPRRQDS